MDRSSIWDLLQGRSAVCGAAEAEPSAADRRIAAGAQRGREAPDRNADGGGSAAASLQGNGAGASSYFKTVEKHCDKRLQDSFGRRFEARCVGCRSRFCKQCCVGLGLSLRERLIPVLETFTGLMMWTFTIDPSLFASPGAAYEYARENRCVSRAMRELRRRGFLHSRRYVVFVEWQGKTEMAHWHVLCDASFVPFDAVCEIWNRFRPSSAGPVEGKCPGFGSIRFSAPKFESPKHAAFYGCKYLIQEPQNGYPKWVLESCDIHRFSTSRGFWPAGDEPEAEPAEPSAGDIVDVRDGRCVEDVVHDEVAEPEGPGDAEARTTIADRVAGCGAASVVLEIVEGVDPRTGEVLEVRRFVGRLDQALSECAARLDRCLPEGGRRLDLGLGEVCRLFRGKG